MMKIAILSMRAIGSRIRGLAWWHTTQNFLVVEILRAVLSNGRMLRNAQEACAAGFILRMIFS